MFKVGDRVQAVKACHIYYPVGAVGTVLEVGGSDYYVDFDKAIGVRVKADGTRNWYVQEIIAAPATPTSRSNDPATSKGERLVNKYEQVVLAALVMHRGWYKVGPPAIRVEGMTGKELALFTNLPLNSITPRFAPLRRKGLIKDSGERRDKQIVWVLA